MRPCLWYLWFLKLIYALTSSYSTCELHQGALLDHHHINIIVFKKNTIRKNWFKNLYRLSNVSLRILGSRERNFTWSFQKKEVLLQISTTDQQKTKRRALKGTLNVIGFAPWSERVEWIMDKKTKLFNYFRQQTIH